MCLTLICAAACWCSSATPARGTPVAKQTRAAAHAEPASWRSEPEAITVFGRSYDIRRCRKLTDTFVVTAYNLDRFSTGKDPGDPGFGVTSTGRPAVIGRTVAVDPAVIPYGSLLYIEGVGWRIAEDTGGAIRGHHIDVLMPSRKHALQFGVKRNCRVTVYIPDDLDDV